jgi:hypothetical protein
MAYPGGAKATVAQRSEVLRLQGAGWSVRGIAAEVFGDARFRGRVERILARGASPLPPAAPEGAGLDGLAPVEAIKVLFERRLAVLLAGEVTPSMSELQKLLDVSRRLDAIAMVERMNKLANEEEKPA